MIEWNAGSDLSPDGPTSPGDESAPNERGKPRTRRDHKRAEMAKAAEPSGADDSDTSCETVYVAYVLLFYRLSCLFRVYFC